MTARISTLIVDDDDDMRTLATLAIERANHGLVVAGVADNGQDAMAAIEALQPTVVLIDQMMPGWSGTETAAVIRQQHPDVRVVLWTAHLTPQLIQQADEAGVDACLGKGQLGSIPETLRRVAA